MIFPLTIAPIPRTGLESRSSPLGRQERDPITE